MKIEKEGLAGSYDKKNDILYIYYKGREYSYGTEDSDDFVTFRSIVDDSLTGYLIYGFKDKISREVFDISKFDLVFKVAIDKLAEEL